MSGLDHLVPARWRRIRRRREVLEVANTDRLLVLAPHPDDETLGAGGLMAATRAAGGAVRVIVLTDGSRLHGKSEGEAKARLIAARQAECAAATAVLGVSELRFLDAADGRLYKETARLAPRLAEEIMSFRPTRIVLPHPRDGHGDHQAVLPLVRRALRRAGGVLKPQLFGYEIWSPCAPSHVFDIGAVVEVKRRALSHYAATFGAVDLGEMIIGLNRYRAGVAGGRSGWCEAFVQLK